MTLAKHDKNINYFKFVGGKDLDDKKTVNEWKPVIQLVLDSKASEFVLMGYSQATSDEVWNCLQNLVWKGNPTMRLHEIVQDIFHLKASVYMNYLTLNAYQDDDLMTSIAALTKK